ncbi:MAG: trypsin-like peptidase domain-containing protein [Fuerstiella sp.]|jgi:S1-C subfamily serine protease|nr:trypsin-like peptidase domain-containing protein [Fuerstiella sp.]
MAFSRGICGFFLTGLLFIGQLVFADGPNETLVERERRRVQTIARIAPSVVCVMPPGGQGGGSGVLVSADGYAISNYHVTSGCGNFMKCGLNDGKLYDAVIVGVDPTGDIALIKLLGREDFPFCTPGDSDQVQSGDEVLALGNPFLLASDFTPTVTYGIVSGIHRYQYPAGTFLEYTDCIQIDASINPGNSGGPLFDIDGRWIGINGRASFEKRGRINSGAAYAISVRQILLFIDHLKSGRIVDHGRTDFTVGTAADGLVAVQEVSEISEAWRRGLRPGDELVSFGSRALTSANDFKTILGIFPAGIRVPLTFRNPEGAHKTTVRLLPLHGFDAAPQLPEERKPKKRPGGPEPDGQPDSPHQAEAPVIPEQYTHLFKEKKSFTNYYFNQLHRDRLLNPLRHSLAETESNKTATWSISWKLSDDRVTGDLIVGTEGAGLRTEKNNSYQPVNDQQPSNESADLWGVLSAALQWHRLFQSDPDLFSEVVYIGTELLAPSGRPVETVFIQDGAVESRWYFNDESPLPVGVDVTMSAGHDEARIRFDGWQNNVVPSPARIGVVDPETEQLRWLTVEAFDVKPRATNDNAGNQESAVP